MDIRQAVAAYATLRAQNARTVYTLRGTGDSFVQAGKTMGVAGGVMVYAFAKVVQAAAEFERKMDFFAAVSDTNSKKMKQLSDFTLQLATDTIYSADEIAEGFIELGKSGISAEQIMRGVGDAMANLGAAGDIPLAESGQIITSTIQQFDKSAKDAVAVTDLLAGAANASIADITDLGVSLKYVGGVAHTAGLNFEDTLTAISLLAKAGIRGSTAGTSLRQMIVSFGGATAPATEALEELGIITETGANRFYDAAGNLKPLSEVFEILGKATEDLTAKERVLQMRTIFNNRALSAAAILSREGAKGFREMNTAMGKTTAAETASARLDNLSGDIEILRGNIETLMIKAGSPFQEEMRRWVQALTKLVQAFGNLDPKTQENIVRFIGMSGAILVVLGALNIVLGTIFRFIAYMMKMGAAMKFVGRLIMIVVTNLRWFAVLFGGPIIGAIGAFIAANALVIAIILAVIAIFVLLYKKVEPFRNLVNAIASAWKKGFDRLVAIVRTALTDPAKAWEMFKDTVSNNLDAVVGFIRGLGARIGGAFGSALAAVGRFIAGVGRWFASLPGRVLGIITGFVSQVISLFTFRNIGYALGFLIGTVVGFFLRLHLKMLSLAGRMVGAVVGFFQSLPRKVGYALGFLIGRAVALMIRLREKMIELAGRAITGIVNFFQKLPERVARFVLSMVTRAINLFNRVKEEGPRLALETVTGIINFFQNLPARIAAFFVTLASRARQKMIDFKNSVVNFAEDAAQGFVDGIRDLPSAMGDILGDLIQAIRDKITDAFNSVRDFARGLWDGFRDGLNMKSPSIIERAMWQITGTMEREVKRLKRQTLDVQGTARKLARTQFSIGQTTPRTTDKYAALARTHQANRDRARTLLAASQTRRARVNAGTRRAAGAPRERIPMEITNWRQGRGYMYDIAQDAVDDNESYNDSLDGMG
jgi:TP901 family phage tail tape measure protein